MSRLDASEAAFGLRVGIVEDDRTTREALVTLIDGTQGYRVVGQWSSVEAALLESPVADVHVLLLDVHLPGISGPEGVRPLRERYPATAILMLTVYAMEDAVFEAICNGAVGYLLKKTPAKRLLEAIREAATGGAPLSPEIARKVVDQLRRMPARDSVGEALTAQETRLLQLLADGHTYVAAAEKLEISVNTVRSYVRNVYEKLHVHTKSEAVSKAIRRGNIV